MTDIIATWNWTSFAVGVGLGHLIGATLFALAFNYYFKRSTKQARGG